jgi:hypothetical protein
VSTPAAAHAASWASLAGGLGAVLLPKCPLCFAAYGSALGALGVGPAAGPILDALVALTVTVSLGTVLALSWARRDMATPLFSAAGAAGVLAGRVVLDAPAVTAAGAALLVAASLVNAVRCRRAAARG